MIDVCVFTTTRADFGLLCPLLHALKAAPDFNLMLVAAGTHFSAEHGNTYMEILEEGFQIAAKIELSPINDSPSAIVKVNAGMLDATADILASLKPDVVVVLGDRIELLQIVLAANVFRIPIVHLNGGEITEGAIDDSIRHAVTKLSHIHFTAMSEYARRVKQLGENPDLVFSVGEVGLDTIKLIRMTKNDLEHELGVKFAARNFLVTLHPETSTGIDNRVMAENLISALDRVDDTLLVFTKANSDPGNMAINEVVAHYCAKHPHKARLFPSLGRKRYISFARHCRAVIGNSSSGIVEIPSLGVPSINIGCRQQGRISAASVIHCDFTAVEIHKAIQLALSEDFRSNASKIQNPYGDGNSSQKIMDLLRSINLGGLTPKKFFDKG